jgi:5-methylcytosine-specific restriction endonuclease McrA
MDSQRSIRRPRIKLDGIFAKGIISGTSYNLLFAVDTKDEPCVYCGQPSDTYEHVVPRSLGGKNDGNRVRACEKCNRQRGSRPFLVWMLKRRNE